MSKKFPPGSRPPDITFREVSGTRPIEPISSSVAGFVGVAPNPQARLGEAVPVTHWGQFHSASDPGALFSDEVIQGGQKIAAPWTDLALAVYGFFLNGGRRCYVVNIGTTDGRPLLGDNSNRQEDIAAGLDVLARIDEITIVAAPGFTADAHHQALKEHCEACQNRLAILDPDMDALTPQLDDEIHLPVASKEGYLAMYYPWIKVGDITGSGGTVLAPPSGHVAGVWARTDESRGVHKAPANEVVRGALDLAYRLSDDQHGRLNEAGVNAIRALRGQSIKLWGARTLSPGEMWRYLNVRRLVNLLIGSIAQGTRWVVFEPPGEELWGSVRRDVQAFLQRFQQQGALASAGTGAGFFVKCDEENNPPESRVDGRVVIDIGLAGISTVDLQIIRIIQTDSGTIIEWPETSD